MSALFARGCAWPRWFSKTPYCARDNYSKCPCCCHLSQPFGRNSPRPDPSGGIARHRRPACRARAPAAKVAGPAWHTNLAKARARARARLWRPGGCSRLAARAAGLPASHHGSRVPMSRLQSASPVVLKGPQNPQWCCNCGTNNWRSRIECRQCQRSAPRSIIDKAKAADKVARQGASKTYAQAAVAPRVSPPSVSRNQQSGVALRDLQRQLKEHQQTNDKLRREPEQLKAQGKEADDDDQMEQDAGASQSPGPDDVEKLRKAVAAMRALFGESDSRVQKLASDMATAQSQRKAALPIPTHIRNAEAVARKRTKQKESAAALVTRCSEAAAAAAKQLQEAQAGLADKEKELDAAQESLDDLRRQQLLRLLRRAPRGQRMARPRRWHHP